MDISTLTETELKALAYDQVKLLNQTQANLALIEQELAKRLTPVAFEGREPTRCEEE